MLAPDQRTLLLQALRPPPDYRFDCGIGTTFSLDFMSLLVVPMSFTLMDVDDPDEALEDPVMLLEGLRRYADRLTVFCQAGRIAIPSQDSYLYQFLETMVVEVQSPFEGVFHPKVWLLRYEAESGCAERAPLFRLLNLSRNLTSDKSWDLILRLEGELATHRQLAYARNHPLGNFIQALPSMAVHPPGRRIVKHVDRLQDEVRRVDFQTPAPFFDELGFYPAGLHGRRAYRFKEDCDRAMVISPFLSDRMLRRITEQGSGHILVSSADSIGNLKPATRDRFEKIYVLHDMGVEEENTVDEVGESVVGMHSEPVGLHAKLFIVESGWDATWLMGSANATDAAFFRHNVEFMVELKGRKSKIGIDQVLGPDDDEASFRSLLRLYHADEVEDNGDEERKRAEELANEVRDWLVSSQIHLDVVQVSDGLFDLTLLGDSGDQVAPSGEFDIKCWLISLREQDAVKILPSTPFPERFSELSKLSLTSFVAFQVTSKIEMHTHILRFVLNLPITGLPLDREDHIYSAILSDQVQFLRYLRILLADRDDAATYWMTLLGGQSEAPRSVDKAAVGTPLLKALVRALSRSPNKIRQIARVVERLQRTPEGRNVLTEDFRRVWDALEQTQNEIEIS